jgi:hypothetical protein
MARRVAEKGHRCEEYERELKFFSYPLAVEKIVTRLPRSEEMGDYKVIFDKKVWGGYKVDIIRGNGSEVAKEVKVRKWKETKVKDPENGNTLMLKLSFVYPQSIRVTVFKDGEN